MQVTPPVGLVIMDRKMTSAAEVGSSATVGSMTSSVMTNANWWVRKEVWLCLEVETCGPGVEKGVCVRTQGEVKVSRCEMYVNRTSHEVSQVIEEVVQVVLMAGVTFWPFTEYGLHLWQSISSRNNIIITKISFKLSIFKHQLLELVVFNIYVAVQMRFHAKRVSRILLRETRFADIITPNAFRTECVYILTSLMTKKVRMT